ncbi:MAG: hypothetical protein UT02_C0017G0021 [Parcubacteria group bacterium GW2011_GWC2_38_7]|nr:MAG: hypothetical protein UT02_C0017G0021 [Parcubacteria group bacterium GW2011_GWC2_38_7]
MSVEKIEIGQPTDQLPPELIKVRFTPGDSRDNISYDYIPVYGYVEKCITEEAKPEQFLPVVERTVAYLRSKPDLMPGGGYTYERKTVWSSAATELEKYFFPWHDLPDVEDSEVWVCDEAKRSALIAKAFNYWLDSLVEKANAGGTDSGEFSALIDNITFATRIYKAEWRDDNNNKLERALLPIIQKGGSTYDLLKLYKDLSPADQCEGVLVKLLDSPCDLQLIYSTAEQLSVLDKLKVLYLERKDKLKERTKQSFVKLCTERLVNRMWYKQAYDFVDFFGVDKEVIAECQADFEVKFKEAIDGTAQNGRIQFHDASLLQEFVSYLKFLGIFDTQLYFIAFNNTIFSKQKYKEVQKPDGEIEVQSS